MSTSDVGGYVTAWARDEPSVSALVLIGSQARLKRRRAMAADRHSDWDFYVVTYRPGVFLDRAWMRTLGVGEPLAYVARQNRLGGVSKVSVVMPTGELDIVVLPARQLRIVHFLVRWRLIHRFKRASRMLGDLSMVLGDGYVIEKGERGWGSFFREVAERIVPTRLGDDEVLALLEGFVCDYVSTKRKIMRGEMLAAQRWLHHYLAETNFQLLREHGWRSGIPISPDARRLEFSGAQTHGVEVRAVPEPDSLIEAIERSRQEVCRLAELLLGASWRWPQLAEHKHVARD